MAIYHMEAKVISRGSGRSAVAASAYMSCSRMYNDYDGIQHDYTRKHGLVYQEVMLPPMAPAEWKDREHLWNAVEEAEKTKDSRLAREFVVALPIELDNSSNISLLQDFIQKNFVDMGMCADFAIHDTDGHNPHAHILLTVRPLNEDGTWQYKTEKEYLCIKNGEEKGFTASEFREAQKEGWEKQYRYQAGKKKYQMLHNEMQTASAKDWIKMTKPVIEKYKAIKQEIHKKQEERKILKTKKQKLSILNPLQHYQLNQQITTLTEDIEELKSKKNFLMGEIYCHNETEMKNAESTIKQQSAFLEKLAAQRQSLNEQLGKNRKKFIDLKLSVAPEKSEELLDARVSFRDIVRDRIVSRLRDVYGKKFEYDRLNDASDYIDGCIREDSYLFRERAWQKVWEQEEERKRNQPNKAKNKSRDYEL